MENKLIFATGNKDKLVEIAEILDGIEVISMKEAGADLDIEENGTTFEENSLIKAKAVWEVTKGLVLADDSGLEVDALNKEPGIYSSRYMGKDTTYHEKNMNLIGRLNDAGKMDPSERSARFVCAISAVFPDGTHAVVRETMEGYIGFKEEGENGFGFDPIFIMPKFGVSNSMIPSETKHAESHRGKALRKMREELVKRGYLQ